MPEIPGLISGSDKDFMFAFGFVVVVFYWFGPNNISCNTIWQFFLKLYFNLRT